jgi:flagellar biosynthetic protein FlhB
MPEGNDQERTEPATPKRRQEARKKGNVAQSREIPSVLVLWGALGFFFFSGSSVFWGVSEFMRHIFQNLESLYSMQGASVYSFFLEVLGQLFMSLLPLMLVVLFAALAGNFLQIGFMFTTEPMIPKLSKLDPIKGMKKFFSSRALVEAGKSVFKILFVGGIAFLMVKGELETIPSLAHMGVGEILSFVGRVSLRICFYTCLALVVLAAVDYTYQRWQYEKNLRMTKQEVKDELKQREGDPAVKSKIRKIQMEMSRRRMMEAVPEADVVITNPTSLAIALKYNAEEMVAPQVVAKGAGFVAERIREIAKESGVPLVEHKPLAQTLFKAVDVGGFIPFDLYRAVAEILAYVYRLKGTNQ